MIKTQRKTKQHSLDDIDKAILRALQSDGSLGHKELAAQVKLSMSATHKRVQQLKRLGVIQQSTVLLGREHLGFDVMCYLHIKLKQHTPKVYEVFRSQLNSLDHILECAMVAGEDDFILKAVFVNHRELQDFTTEKLLTMDIVASVRTTIVLNEFKSTTALPIR